MDSNQMLLVLLVAVNIVLSAYNIHSARRISSERQRHHEEIRSLNSDISALCSGATGLGNHLNDIEQQLRRLYERQDQIELRDPGEREYHNAVRMIQDGADMEKLIDVCGLARGEAELLMRLHGVEHGGPQSAQRIRSVSAG